MRHEAGMKEVMLASAIAFGIVLAQFVATTFAAPMGSPVWLLLGLGSIALGLLVSIPAAGLYHLRLHAALSRRGALDKGWIWHPTRLHARLLDDERPPVMWWFSVGVAGWSLALLGCALIGLGVFGVMGA
jgi:hypothetical protein